MKSGTRLHSCLLIIALLSLPLPACAQDQPAIRRLGQLYNFWYAAYEVAVDGDFAYVATDNSGLQIVDISDPEQPLPVSSYVDFPDDPYTVDVDDQLLVASSSRKLWIMDVANPHEPRFTGEYILDGYRNDVVLSHHTIYVATWNGVEIVDVSDPASPVLSGFWNAGMNDAYFVAVRDSLLYAVTSGMTGNRLTIVNLADPDSLCAIGYVQFEDTPQDFYMAGNLAWVVIGNYWEPGENRLIAFDISNIEEPAIAANWQFEDQEEWQVKRIAGDGRYLFVTSTDVGLEVLDFEDPTDPVRISSLDLPFECYGIAATDRNIFCAAAFDHFKVLDISDPRNPDFIGSYATGMALSVDVLGETAVLGTGRDGVRIVDVSTPEFPEEVYHYEPVDSVTGVNIDGNWVFVAMDSAGMAVLDISDPHDVQEICRFDTPGSAASAVVHGQYVFVADGESELLIYDFSNPAEPEPVAQFDTQAERITIRNDAAYCAGAGGFEILDVTNPLQPLRIGEFGSAFNDVEVEGNHAFLTQFWRGVFILDITDPRAPVFENLVENYAPGAAFDLYEDYGYFASRRGLGVVNLLEVDNPHQAGFLYTGGYSLDVKVAGGAAYLADWTNFGIYDCSGALGVFKKTTIMPGHLELVSVYPNPFNSAATVSINMPLDAVTSVKIFDPCGREVHNGLPYLKQGAGRSWFAWNACGLPSGSYLLKIEAGGNTQSKNLIVAK